MKRTVQGHGRGGARRRSRWVGGVALAALSALSALQPAPASAQEGTTLGLGPVLGRRVGRQGGPSLGKVGLEAQLFRFGEARRGWGIAVGYHPLGRFPHPSGRLDEQVVVVGPRIRWKAPGAGPAFATLGLDVVSVAHETADNDGPGRDPGVGAFAGLGYALTPGTSGPHLFLEGGVHALAVTGELTNGGGVYATLMLGVAF